MTRGNKEILDTMQNGKQIHLFVKFSPQEYYYQGLFTLINYTYEDDKDELGNVRKEYKFRLRKKLRRNSIMKIIKVVAAIICDSFENTKKIFAAVNGYGDFKGMWEFREEKLK